MLVRHVPDQMKELRAPQLLPRMEIGLLGVQ
jgi:hypothetical protein